MYIDKKMILSKIKSHLGFKSDSDFAKFLGIKPQTLSSWYSRNTFDVDLIYSKCVNIDCNFLITGEGEIEKTKTREKHINDIIEKKTAFTHETKNVRDMIPQGPEPYEGIPLIPIDAMAGFGTGSIQVMNYDTERYRIPEFTELKVDFMIRVKGSSMYPKYNSGDLVACKKLNLHDVFFQWNKVYVLDTEQGALIKRIKKGKDQNHLLLVSDNPNYDPIDLHLHNVNALALVVGVIRLE